MAPCKIDNQERLAELSAYKRQVASGASDGCPSRQYKEACRSVKAETRKLLSEWWQLKAASIQEQVDQKTPQHQFAGYRELRRVFVHGRQLARTLKAANGFVLDTKEARIRRWQEYFLTFLLFLLQCRHLNLIRLVNFSLRQV